MRHFYLIIFEAHLCSVKGVLHTVIYNCVCLCKEMSQKINGTHICTYIYVCVCVSMYLGC